MAKQKRKLSAAEKVAKKQRKREYVMVFVHGKQKWVKRPGPILIEGIPEEEWIRNADPIWLHQNELWETIRDD